ncbi:MAG: hypothetical protein ACLFPH_07565, partial [Bacteroidales bacterium]
MRIFCLVILSSLFTLNVASQEWENSKHFGGDGNYRIHEVEVDNNNIYVAGLLSGTNDTITSHGSFDVFLAKLDNELNLEWFKQIGGELFDDLYFDITVHKDIVYFLLGAQDTVYFAKDDTLISDGSHDVFLASYLSDGNVNYIKKIAGSSTAQRATSLDIDNNEDIIVGGFYTDSITFENDTIVSSGTNQYLGKFDIDGNYIWSKNIPGTNSRTRLTSINAYSDGYYIDGYFVDSLLFDIETITSTSSDVSDLFLYKTDYNGDGIWVRRGYGNGNDVTGSITKDDYGNIYYTGYFNSDTLTIDYDENIIAQDTLFNKGDFDIFINKYNREGNLQWTKAYQSPNREYAVDIAQNYGNLYIGGYYTDSIAFGNDTLISPFVDDRNMFVSIFDLEGNHLKANHILGSDNGADYIDGIALSKANHSYLGGYFKSSSLYVGDSTYTNSNTNALDGLVVEYFAPLSAAFTDQQNVSCPGSDNGMLVVKPYFGVPPYEYSWSHTDTLASDTATN